MRRSQPVLTDLRQWLLVKIQKVGETRRLRVDIEHTGHDLSSLEPQLHPLQSLQPVRGGVVLFQLLQSQALPVVHLDLDDAARRERLFHLDLFEVRHEANRLHRDLVVTDVLVALGRAYVVVKRDAGSDYSDDRCASVSHGLQDRLHLLRVARDLGPPGCSHLCHQTARVDRSQLVGDGRLACQATTDPIRKLSLREALRGVVLNDVDLGDFPVRTIDGTRLSHTYHCLSSCANRST